ncbi:MAG: DNA polymerase domain-containing protein [Pseudomonadota bacterium]
MGYNVNAEDLPPAPGTYDGATVLAPTPGYHESPVVCLDFASLYPSCIVAYNLCLSTILRETDAAAASGPGAGVVSYEVAGRQERFVSAAVQQCRDSSPVPCAGSWTSARRSARAWPGRPAPGARRWTRSSGRSRSR